MLWCALVLRLVLEVLFTRGVEVDDETRAVGLFQGRLWETIFTAVAGAFLHS